MFYWIDGVEACVRRPSHPQVMNTKRTSYSRIIRRSPPFIQEENSQEMGSNKEKKELADSRTTLLATFQGSKKKLQARNSSDGDALISSPFPVRDFSPVVVVDLRLHSKLDWSCAFALVFSGLSFPLNMVFVSNCVKGGERYDVMDSRGRDRRRRQRISFARIDPGSTFFLSLSVCFAKLYRLRYEEALGKCFVQSKERRLLLTFESTDRTAVVFTRIRPPFGPPSTTCAQSLRESGRSRIAFTC